MYESLLRHYHVSIKILYKIGVTLMSVNQFEEELDNKKMVFMAKACIQTYIQFKYNGSLSIPNGYRLVQVFKAKVFRVFEWFGYIIESENDAINLPC